LFHTPRILIAGCGYTGERCADFFCAAGWEVTGLVRSAASAARLAAKPFRVVAADAACEAGLRQALAGLDAPDALVHCLSGSHGREADAYRLTYVTTLRNLLAIYPRTFPVFTCSTSVYPQNDGGEVTEESPVGGSPTGDVLLEAESLALRSGGAVVRLGGIYGPGRARFITAVLAGEPMPQGPSGGFVNLVHRDDAAAALTHVATRRLRGVFNAVDDEPSRRADLASRIAQACGREVSSHAEPDRAPAGKKVGNRKLKSTGWVLRFPDVVTALTRDEDLRASVGLPPGSPQAPTQSR
jgi:nucleoside-diphosphate-sugar epimerase